MVSLSAAHGASAGAGAGAAVDDATEVLTYRQLLNAFAELCHDWAIGQESAAHGASAGAGAGAAVDDATEVLTYRQLVNGFAELGHHWAIGQEHVYCFDRTNGYESNQQPFKDLLMSLVSNGNETALEFAVRDLLFGKKVDKGTLEARNLAARNLIEQAIIAGSEQAQKLQIQGYQLGIFGYGEDPASASSKKRKYEGQWTRQDRINGITGLCHRKNDHADAKRDFEKMVEDGDEYAIMYKSRQLVQGGVYFGETISQDLEAATEMLRAEQQKQLPTYLIK